MVTLLRDLADRITGPTSIGSRPSPREPGAVTSLTSKTAEAAEIDATSCLSAPGEPLGFSRQIREIGRDPALRIFGGALALTHALTMLSWRQNHVRDYLGSATDAICWPLVPNCVALHVFSGVQLAWAFRGYFVISILVAILFASRKTVGWAYAGLIALTVGKLLILALDFRLRLNQHYMALRVTLVFLLLPAKRDTLRILLVLFYLWASTLKFNADWVSGAALHHPLWLVPASWTSAACVYVIILEVAVIWGLLAARGWVFWGALAQLVLFHVMSFSQVGWFYPLLMFLLLALFPLARLIPPPEGEHSSLFARLFRLRLHPAAYLLIAGFSFFQLIPAIIPGDEALTGEGRPFALHMIDARTECRAWAVVQRTDGTRQEVELTSSGVPPRIGCDPILIVGRARNLCRRANPRLGEVVELDLHLIARRSWQPSLRPVIDLPGFCARRVGYNPFWHNDWIQISV